jgi:hypothetical protein
MQKQLVGLISFAITEAVSLGLMWGGNSPQSGLGKTPAGWQRPHRMAED